MEERIDWNDPTCIAGRRGGERTFQSGNGLGRMAAQEVVSGRGNRRIDRVSRGERFGGLSVAARSLFRLIHSSCRTQGGRQPRERRRVGRESRQGLLKCRNRLVVAALIQLDRAQRVPRVRGALPAVELSRRFEFELVSKTLHGCVLFAAGEDHESAEQMEAHRAKGTTFARRATWTVAASQCARARPGMSPSVRCAARSRSSPQLT